MKKVLSIALILTLLTISTGTFAATIDIEFRKGIKFGMTNPQVKSLETLSFTNNSSKRLQTSANAVINGRSKSKIGYEFDDNGKLYLVDISYGQTNTNWKLADYEYEKVETELKAEYGLPLNSISLSFDGADFNYNSLDCLEFGVAFDWFYQLLHMDMLAAQAQITGGYSFGVYSFHDKYSEWLVSTDKGHVLITHYISHAEGIKATTCSEFTSYQLLTTSEYNELVKSGKIQSKSSNQDDNPSDNLIIVMGKTGVREKPSYNSDIILNIEIDTTFAYLSCDNGWYCIKLEDGTEGYVYNKRCKVIK